MFVNKNLLLPFLLTIILADFLSKPVQFRDMFMICKNAVITKYGKVFGVI